MLDDLRQIAQIDKSGALDVIAKDANQLEYNFNISFKPSGKIENIVLDGMGGSALPAPILQSWPELNVPFEVVRNYSLPHYINEQTLYIASSYSGNTEEAIAGFHEALKKKAQIVVMSAGGELAQLATKHNLPLLHLPGGIQPRMTTFYFLAGFIQILEPLGLLVEGGSKDLHAAAKWLQDKNKLWIATVPTNQNQAKQIAEKLLGKTVIVYSGPRLYPAANKWKIAINENAKNLAWANQYPEFDHNEFIGWTSHPIEKPFAVVEIRSSLENPRTQKRFALSEKLLSGKRPAPIVVTPQGSTLVEQLLWAITLGDYVSIYLAILNGVDPTPVDLVEKFKKELDQ